MKKFLSAIAGVVIIFALCLFAACGVNDANGGGDSAIERIIFEGNSAEWEEVMNNSHKNWNMGKREVEVIIR